MPRHTDFSAERSRSNKIGSERLQGLVTTASLSFWLPGCLSKLSCNQNQRLGYSALIKAVHKADFPLYNSDIHLSFAGLISGGADGQESDEPQGSVSKENHKDQKYNLGRTGKYRYHSRREECDMERMIDAETEELSKREKYRERRGEEYDVVSKVAFLIGVPDSHWKSQYTGLDADIYEQLNENKNARIIRNLCGLRTEIERNFKRFSMLILMELKNLHTIPQTQGMVNQLRKDEIDIIKANPKLEEYLPKINALLQQHIDACKSLFPIWVNWEFVRQLFIIPGGNSTKKSKEVFEYYMENLERYPYRMFINWRWSKDEEGNLLYNDEKFLSRLYQQNGEVFTGYSNVRGEGRETKRNIYGFVDASEQTVALVDCENCDPLKLCAALQSMQPETLAKITKIILYNDVNASSAWNLLQKHTKATIEHQMSERVLTGKSLVDVMLVAGCCKEHYVNKVDSFLLFSSDSDYWGLISSVSTAKFLVMVEQNKVSSEIVQKMIDSDIPFCYLDQFCQGGQSHKMKVDALLSECQRFVGRHFESFNVKEMMNVAHLQTRIELSKAEEKQFYERYIKTMRIKISADGSVNIEFGS